MPDTIDDTPTIADPLAVSIMEGHAIAEDATKGASDAILRAIAARQATAALVDAAKARHGRALKDWWTSHLPAMEWGIERRYMQVHRIAGKDGGPDKRQLMLTGILESPKARDGRFAIEANPLAWVSLVTRLAAALESLDVATIPAGARIAVVRPLARLTEALAKVRGQLADLDSQN